MRATLTHRDERHARAQILHEHVVTSVVYADYYLCSTPADLRSLANRVSTRCQLLYIVGSQDASTPVYIRSMTAAATRPGAVTPSITRRSKTHARHGCSVAGCIRGRQRGVDGDGGGARHLRRLRPHRRIARAVVAGGRCHAHRDRLSGEI